MEVANGYVDRLEIIDEDDDDDNNNNNNNNNNNKGFSRILYVLWSIWESWQQNTGIQQPQLPKQL